MLGEFQQALADLTSSPPLCVAVRREPALLRERYDLTPIEWRRLVAIVNDPGMRCACIVYRANRLAPLALNLPRVCKALGKDLRDVASSYWAAFPQANVHFYLECDRFCGFVAREIEQGRTFSDDLAPALADERSVVASALDESHTER